jgi:prephenate dehydratase
MKIIKVAYHGIRGSFTYLAALNHFQNNAVLESHARFSDIFQNLDAGIIAFGVIPIENSLAGSVHENYDLLWRYDLKIVGEIYLKISHNLLALPSSIESVARLKTIKKVFSHPKAIEQCERFFNENPHIEKVLSPDTASAAKLVAESNDITLAAIASTQACSEYGLQTISQHLEDNPSNITRFVVLSREISETSISNKCSIIFTLPHIPQSLFHALEVISDSLINITKIESRPIHGKPFEYAFYVDFEFNQDNKAQVNEVIKKFGKKVLSLKILGFYERKNPLDC